MTQADIARMIKLCGVPRSRTVEVLYPNPCVTIYTDDCYWLLVIAVAREMSQPGQLIQVEALGHARDVKPGEHVFYKVSTIGPRFAYQSLDDKQRRNMRNRQTTIDIHVA